MKMVIDSRLEREFDGEKVEEKSEKEVLPNVDQKKVNDYIFTSKCLQCSFKALIIKKIEKLADFSG